VLTIDWNDGILEEWNDGMAPFGQINAYGGNNLPGTISPLFPGN